MKHGWAYMHVDVRRDVASYLNVLQLFYDALILGSLIIACIIL